MHNFKYQNGDLIGPYKIKMIKRLEKKDKTNHYYGLFICPKCEKIFESKISNVSRGCSTSCGCRQKENQFIAQDLTDKKFGRLVVLEDTGKTYKVSNQSHSHI